MSQRQPEDNENLLNFIASTVEVSRDRLESTVTKEGLTEELAKVEAKLNSKIEVEVTTVRGDIEQVQLRLDGIDKALSLRMNHIETDLSRMRSVLYLLVKDRPDMLRLLGPPQPPAGG